MFAQSPNEDLDPMHRFVNRRDVNGCLVIPHPGDAHHPSRPHNRWALVRLHGGPHHHDRSFPHSSPVHAPQTKILGETEQSVKIVWDQWMHNLMHETRSHVDLIRRGYFSQKGCFPWYATGSNRARSWTLYIRFVNRPMSHCQRTAASYKCVTTPLLII